MKVQAHTSLESPQAKAKAAAKAAENHGDE